MRGLGVMKPEQQLENLIDWLGKMKGALPTVEDMPTETSVVA